MTNSRFELLSEYTSAGYAFAKDSQSDRVCVLEGDCVIYTTEYEDIWCEYPQGTFFQPLVWIAPDRFSFFRDGYWGVRKPDGEIVIPDEFETILNYRQSGYYIVRDKRYKVGCVDKDFNCIFPCEYEWVPLREKLDEIISSSPS